MFVNQPSLGYTTCFELVNQGVVSSSELYVFVFPKGIHLTNSSYQKTEILLLWNSFEHGT
jgi:hypothetical protein